MSRYQHVVHESYGDRVSREKYKTNVLLGAIGIFMVLGGFGAILSGEFSWALWLLILGGALTWFSFKGARWHASQVGQGHRISYG
mgnify:CR=1 FL=1